MSILGILGYGALALLVIAFAAKTIITLRSFALVASVAVLLYGIFSARYEVAAIGVVMAAVNLWRLGECVASSASSAR